MTRTKRVMTMLTVLALTVALAAPALALGPIETATPGSIMVSVPEPTYRDDFTSQEPAVQIGVLVYKLADVDVNGLFTPEPGFEALALEENAGLWNGGVLNEGLIDVQGLVAAAENLIWYGTTEAPTEPEEPAESEESEGEREPILPATFTASVDAPDGEIALGEHGLGLYMLLPQKTDTVQWEYTFSPALVAVPLAERGTAGAEGGIPSEGQWQYAPSVELKAERVSRLTDILIEKTLQEYNATLGPTTFLFEVTAVQNGRTVYSNVVSLTFSGTGTQSVTLEGIPVGAHVTVTEVYSGGSYVPADGRVSVDIPALPLPAEGEFNRVPFTNTYTNGRVPDGSVVNRYVYDGTGWDHQEVAGQ